MNPHYPRVAERAGQRCEYCLAPEIVFNFPFEVEHVVPKSRAGRDTLVNLALACRSCNLQKAAHLVGTDPFTNESVSLFHPRHDSWIEHFRVDPDSALLQGLTATGRATVARLKMNSDAQVAARHQWKELDLYP